MSKPIFDEFMKVRNSISIQSAIMIIIWLVFVIGMFKYPASERKDQSTSTVWT